MESFNIAIIGVGRWGINHVRVLSNLKKIEDKTNSFFINRLIVVDKNKDRLKNVALRYTIDAYYNDIEEMLKRENVDIAFIIVPTIYHHIVAEKLLPYSHIFIEKPIASTLENAKKLLDLSKEYNKVIAVGHIERFNPVVIAVKDYLKKISEKIIHILGLRIGPGPVGSKTGNLGVAHDLLIHDIDISNMILDSIPVKVLAVAGYTPNFPYETEINAIYEYSNQTIAYLRTSWMTGPRLKKRLMMIQTFSNVITFDYISQIINVERGLKDHKSSGEYIDIISSYTSRNIENISLVSGSRYEPLLLEIKSFLENIANKKKPIVDGEKGYNALKCIIAALTSAKKQKPIEIS